MNIFLTAIIGMIGALAFAITIFTIGVLSVKYIPMYVNWILSL